MLWKVGRLGRPEGENCGVTETALEAEKKGEDEAKPVMLASGEGLSALVIEALPVELGATDTDGSEVGAAEIVANTV